MSARGAILGLALALAGCAQMQSHVHTTALGTAASLPRPRQIVITDFAVTPDRVQLDTSVGARLRREANGETQEQAVQQAASEAQQALAEELVAKLTPYGLPVQRLPASTVPPPDSLLVQGQILSINEGSRTRRTLVGLGAGQSRVTADAQLYYVRDPSRPQFVQSFQASGDSGRMPGAAETMGAGAAAQHVATSAAAGIAMHGFSERYKTGDAANAAKAANALAGEIGAFARQQGWVF